MASYYIATTGNDSTGAGTLVSPWLTISKAFNSSTANDTINVAAGTYTWVSQTFTSNRTIQGAGNTTTIFTGADAAIAWNINTNGVSMTINDMTFKNSITTSSYVFWNNTGVGSTNMNWTFNRIIFKDLATSSSSRAIFGFSESGGATDMDIMFNTCLFDNMYLVGSPSACEFLNLSQGTGQVLSFTNCTFYVTGGTIVTWWVVVATVTFTVKNCIFYNTSGTNITLNSSGTPTFSYNCTYTNWTSVPSGTANITSDPLLVSPTTGNFNLRPTSPCIDTGVLV